MAVANVTAARVRETLEYDATTGEFTHRIKRSRNTVAGARVKLSNQREARIRLDGRAYVAHRLAWLYMTGEWPKHEVDHIDGNPRNNQWANLRDVPHQINLQNLRKARSDNKVGMLGVSPARGGFIAQIAAPDGRRLASRQFKTAEEAHDHYLEMKRNLHAGCTL